MTTGRRRSPAQRGWSLSWFASILAIFLPDTSEVILKSINEKDNMNIEVVENEGNDDMGKDKDDMNKNKDEIEENWNDMDKNKDDISKNINDMSFYMKDL